MSKMRDKFMKSYYRIWGCNGKSARFMDPVNEKNGSDTSQNNDKDDIGYEVENNDRDDDDDDDKDYAGGRRPPTVIERLEFLVTTHLPNYLRPRAAQVGLP